MKINGRMIFSMTIILLILLGITFYLGVHLSIYLQILFQQEDSSLFAFSFWVIFLLLSFAYMLSRIFVKQLPTFLFKFLHIVGAYWMAVIFYLFFFLVIADIVAMILLFSTTWSKEMIILLLGSVVGLAIVGILVKSRHNALNTETTHYDITVNKENDYGDTLSVVLISDLHLSNLVTNKRLEWLVEKINSLSPDLVLIAGDIIDEDITPFIEQKMQDTLKSLQPSIGTYAIPGNHDYYGGHIEHLAHHLKEAGVHFLLDTSVLVKDSFYIIGRKDLASRDRLELVELMNDIDQTKPIILLDHQPYKLDIPSKLGVDLQVSGHTHRGQFMPNHLITKRIFELDWGYLKKKNTHFIVSSGFGTWGPPIRNGNPSEIITITMNFKKKES